MHVGPTVTITLKLPTRKDSETHKSSILFDFHGAAEGISKATEMDVTVEYGYPGRYRIPEVHLVTGTPQILT